MSFGLRFTLLSALVVAAGMSALPASAAQDSIVLYNGQHKDATNALVEAFEKKTNIKVESRNGNSNELAHQIIAEGDKSPADIIYTEESSPQVMLARQGLLAKIDDAAVENISTDYRDADNRWTGVLGRSRVVVYNPEMITEDELPTSVMDLQGDEWDGRFAFVPTSGAFQKQLSAMIKLEGRDAAKAWLEGLKEHGKTYRKNTVALDAVERGEIDFALINNYYWDRQAKEKGIENINSRLYFFGTNDLGDMLTVASMGILESSNNKEAAQQFIAFATSMEGQQILTDKSAQYPLNTQAETHPDLKPFDELTPPKGTLDLGEYGDGKAAVELLQEVGLL